MPITKGNAMESPKTAVRFSPRLPLVYRLFHLFLQFAAWLLFRVQIAGRENIPAGNYIVVANHLNSIDPFLLMLALPPEPRLYFIGASQVANRPWKTWLLAHFDGMIPVERGARWVGKDIFSKPLEVLASGACLALFPEGHNGAQEGELEPLQTGVGHLLTRGDYTILPVALSGVQELYWRKSIGVTIGRPFHVRAEGLAHRAAIQQATAQVASELSSIIPPYHAPVVANKRLLFLTNLLG